MVEGAGVGGVSQSFFLLDILPLSLDAYKYCMDILPCIMYSVVP